MIEADKRKAVFLLHQEGMSAREIARRLQLSRNTVRTMLKQKGEMPVRVRKDKIRIEAERLERMAGRNHVWMAPSKTLHNGVQGSNRAYPFARNGQEWNSAGT